MIVIQGVGDLTVGERVDALRDERGQRSFAVALHLRLRAAYRGLPAGTEFVVGYADAAAAVPAAEEAPPATDGTVPAPDATAEQVPQPTLATIPTAPGSLPEFAAPASRDTSGTQSPPPGGFTQSPPIDEGVQAGLLSGEYAFPVLGGASFSDDFGAPRATTGFHQGIDLFAPHGTPLLAVHDGVVFRVGWNNLGGRRLWLDDGQGNLFYYAHLSAFSPSRRRTRIWWGGYRIGRLLGRGGMGEVYEAEHVESGRRVALKVLRGRLQDADERARFLREGQLAASISHPHTVYIFGSEEIAGMPVISMELLPGGTLKDRVAAEGPLPPAEAVAAVLDIIGGLDAAQAAGILHRDIKPSNCFVDSDGSVKVGDFGLSISTLARDVQRAARDRASRARRSSPRPSSCAASRSTCARTSTPSAPRSTTCSPGSRRSTRAICASSSSA